MRTIIEQFLSGALDIKDFQKMLREDQNLRETIQALIPEEAKGN